SLDRGCSNPETPSNPFGHLHPPDAPLAERTRSNIGDFMLSSADALTEDIDAGIMLTVLAQVKGGDFAARMPLDWSGLAGEIARSVNDVIIANQSLEAELARVSQVVGTEGKLSQRLMLGGWAQSWSGSAASVNSLIDHLVRPTIEMQRV